jgi:hypothetical protein
VSLLLLVQPSQYLPPWVPVIKYITTACRVNYDIVRNYVLCVWEVGSYLGVIFVYESCVMWSNLLYYSCGQES